MKALAAACLMVFAASAADRPKACAVLHAGLPVGPDTNRIQATLNLCEPGRAVVLARDGRNNRFESGPLILPRGVTLFLGDNVELDASTDLKDYALPAAGKGETLKPFLYAYQAPFSGVSGPGVIDGRGIAASLVSSYESQGFHVDGITLRNGAGFHLALFKTIAPVISDVKIDDSTAGSGLLLSNTTNANISGTWIRVPGEAVVLQASILGPTSNIAFRDLHILGGRGISIGDPIYGPVRGVTFNHLEVERVPSPIQIHGAAQAIAVHDACVSGALPAAVEAQGVAASGCATHPFVSAPKSALTADVSALPVFGTARSLTVALDGSGGFQSIQSAIDALPSTGGEITVKPGTYRELVTIRKPHTHLHGADPDPAKTVIVYNNGPAAGGTFATGTVFVEADDVSIDHLTIANDLGAGHGQGVALAVTADRAIFRHLRILGAQDTLFAASRYCYGDYGPCVAARQYFEDCYIEGNTDFIFGDSIAVFERCELHGIAAGSVMYTAQSRHTEDQRDSAYVFDRCHLTGDPRPASISLGRPWRPYATVVFLHTQIDAPVIPAGWTEWPRFGKPSLPTAFYAEYDSTGPGANPKAREPYSHQLTAEEVEHWSPAKVLRGWTPAE